MLITANLFSNRRNVAGELSFSFNTGDYQFPVAGPAFDNVHPSVGTYRFIEVQDVDLHDPDTLDGFGPHIVVFENIRQAAGMLPHEKRLAIHGGELDDSDRLYATEGGLRISNEDLHVLVNLIRGLRFKKEIQLVVAEQNIGWFKSFSHDKLSKEQPIFVRRRRQVGQSYSTSRQVDDDVYPSSTTGSNSLEDLLYWQLLFGGSEGYNAPHHQEEQFAAGGGSFGGGGASSLVDDNTSAADTDAGEAPLIVNPFPEADRSTATVEPTSASDGGSDFTSETTDSSGGATSPDGNSDFSASTGSDFGGSDNASSTDTSDSTAY